MWLISHNLIMYVNVIELKFLYEIKKNLGDLKFVIFCDFYSYFNWLE